MNSEPSFLPSHLDGRNSSASGPQISDLRNIVYCEILRESHKLTLADGDGLTFIGPTPARKNGVSYSAAVKTHRCQGQQSQRFKENVPKYLARLERFEGWHDSWWEAGQHFSTCASIFLGVPCEEQHGIAQEIGRGVASC